MMHTTRSLDCENVIEAYRAYDLDRTLDPDLHWLLRRKLGWARGTLDVLIGH